MRKVRLSKRYAALLAEKTMDLANMSLVGIVLSQFVATEPFRGKVAILGMMTFFGLHLGAFNS